MLSLGDPLAFYPARVTKGVVLISPSGLVLALLKARSIRNKNSLIWDLISDEEIDLACITETCAKGNTDVSLHEI